MGEIADALRRARDESAKDAPAVARTEDVDPSSIRAAERVVESATPHSRATATAVEPSSDVGTSEPVEGNERLIISREKVGSWIARMVLVEKGGGAEAYRHFCLRVRRELEAREQRSLMIVSGLRQEGKTTTSCNLALAMASMAGGQRIALVDLDLRRPSIGMSFGVQPKIGLESVMQGDATLEQACVPTDLPSLDLYPVESPVHSPHEMLAGPPLTNLMTQLHERYDLIVVDSPPILIVPDTALILPHVGCCIAVLRSRQTRRETFKQMLGSLPPRKLIGTLLNDANVPSHNKDYGYYLSEEESAQSERA